MYKAKIVADSISPEGIRARSVEFDIPTIVLAELNKHRVFSGSTMSMRAIPVSKMVKMVEEDPYFPPEYRSKKRGMSGGDLLDAWDVHSAKMLIEHHMKYSIDLVRELDRYGLHKSICNRYLYPFSWSTCLVTSTEWDNFFELRLAKDADPPIRETAIRIYNCMEESTPIDLKPGEWHAPYANKFGWSVTKSNAYQAAAKCARVSYLLHGDNKKPTPEEDIERADQLRNDKHLVPFEHILTPMERWIENEWTITPGCTCIDKNRQVWSGNSRGWIQMRKIIEEGKL